MRLLDLTLPTAAENLAVEEALLDAAEAGGGGETLRLWEPLTPFVVVGYANQTATEVNLPACGASRFSAAVPAAAPWCNCPGA